MPNPEGLKELSPETLEEKVRNKLTIIHGWNQVLYGKGLDLPKKEQRHGQIAIQRATRDLTKLLGHHTNNLL